MNAILESSEDKVKTLAQRTSGLTLVPFLPRINSLPLNVSLTTEVSFLFFSVFLFLFFIVKQFISCSGLAYILCSTSHISDRVQCHLVYNIVSLF